MEIAYAFFAEAAQITSDGRLNLLGADLHALQFQGDPPWTTALFIVASMRFQHEEGGRTYHFIGDLLGPDGNPMPPHIENAFVAPVPEAEDRLPRMSIVAQLLGVTFPVAGLYHLRVRLEDRDRNLGEEKQVRLRVNGPAPQNQPS